MDQNCRVFWKKKNVAIRVKQEKYNRNTKLYSSLILEQKNDISYRSSFLVENENRSISRSEKNQEIRFEICYF